MGRHDAVTDKTVRLGFYQNRQGAYLVSIGNGPGGDRLTQGYKFIGQERLLTEVYIREHEAKTLIEWCQKALAEFDEVGEEA